jgi:hypothetical protein
VETKTQKVFSPWELDGSQEHVLGYREDPVIQPKEDLEIVPEMPIPQYPTTNIVAHRLSPGSEHISPDYCSPKSIRIMYEQGHRIHQKLVDFPPSPNLTCTSEESNLLFQKKLAPPRTRSHDFGVAIAELPTIQEYSNLKHPPELNNESPGKTSHDVKVAISKDPATHEFPIGSKVWVFQDRSSYIATVVDRRTSKSHVKYRVKFDGRRLKSSKWVSLDVLATIESAGKKDKSMKSFTKASVAVTSLNKKYEVVEVCVDISMENQSESSSTTSSIGSIESKKRVHKKTL